MVTNQTGLAVSRCSQSIANQFWNCELGLFLYQLRSRVKGNKTNRVKGGAGIYEKYRVATSVIFFQEILVRLAKPDAFQ